VAKEKQNSGILSEIGRIFSPVIPGAIIAGLCAGFASLITQVAPEYMNSRPLLVLYNILNLINISFLGYITAWVGYSAAQRFGGTPILGGMLGMITSLGGIDTISQALGLYNYAVPANSVLCSGRGGVIAVILGAWVLARLEKFFHSHIGGSMDGIITPMLSMLCCITLYIFIVMPVTGYISAAICWVIEKLCMSELMAVRIAAGAVCASLFLPLVALGMHLGLAAIYTLQLETTGYITILPALAMAGAAQVGACLAIYTMAGDNNHLKTIIKAGVPAGICGVGQPLIYGVTLPLGKPFLAAGLGAVFGGAYVSAMQVAATTWGPSGILAVFIMTAGPKGAVSSMLHYVIGLCISIVMGFVVTKLMFRPEELAGKLTGSEESE